MTDTPRHTSSRNRRARDRCDHRPSRDHTAGKRGLLQRGSLLTAALLLMLGAAACSSNNGITPVRTAFNRGAYHFSKQNYDAAIHHYRKAVRNNPGAHRARFNLALTLETKARQVDAPDKQARLQDEAQQVYHALLNRRPDHLRGNVNLAAIEYEQGQTKAARKRLQRMIEAYPNHPLPRTALAAHLIERDALAEAGRLLKQAARLDPAGVRVHMLKGRLHRKQGKLAAAAKAYQKALKTSPSDLAAWLALAEVQLERGRLKRARAALERVLLIDPEHWRAHLRLATVLRRAGEVAGAADHLRRAQRLDHQRPRDMPPPDYAGRLQALYQKLARPATQPLQRTEVR